MVSGRNVPSLLPRSQFGPATIRSGFRSVEVGGRSPFGFDGVAGDRVDSGSLKAAVAAAQKNQKRSGVIQSGREIEQPVAIPIGGNQSPCGNGCSIPTGIATGAVNVPSAFPNRMLKPLPVRFVVLRSPWLATTTSSLPSRLKSPTASALGYTRRESR